MQLNRLTALLLWTVPAMLAGAFVVHADNPGQGAYTTVAPDLYTSPPGIGIPSMPTGNVNVVPWNANLTGASAEYANKPYFTSTTVPVGDPSATFNLQGCGGVGQGEYTSALYNMPESFNKFQADATSVLARQLVTMNYTMPQTAALFDQLNNFGTERYAAFQRGCNLDALKQDARKQYLEACVAKVMPNRVTSLSTVTSGDGKKIVDPQLTAMAYAQAWEVCSNQYVSDTTALTARSNANQAFANQVRAVENVTLALEPLLCDFKSNDKDANGASAPRKCWPTVLLPQVRLCLDNTLKDGCTSADGYGVKDPVVSTQRLFDAFRLVMDESLISRRVLPLHTQLDNKSFTADEMKKSAGEAILRLSSAGLNRASTSGNSTEGKLFAGSGATDNQGAWTEGFQFGYLNCKVADPLNSVKEYANSFNRMTNNAADKKIDVPSLAPSDINKVLDNLKLTEGVTTEQKDGFYSLVWVSLGCTANQTVPIFDPYILASLNKCLPPDRYAYYTMAGYDVSLAATRDVYRYLNLRLKQAYIRLMTESIVPTSATTAGTTGTTTSPTVSPELNRRLAGVVKDVMIPYMESQIERLDDLDKTRGQFSQRVQQIYANRGGCVYGGNSMSMPSVNIPKSGRISPN